MTASNAQKTPIRLSAATVAVAALLGLMGHSATAQTTRSPSTVEPSLRYTVQAKDSLIKFSSEVLVEPKAWPEVAKFNALKDANRIYPGQQIDVPLRLLKFRADGAKVISTSGDVSVAAGSNLSEGGQIKVGPNSSAVIELADKSVVKVLPGTLAELLKNRSYAARDTDKSASNTWYSGLVRVVQGQLEVLAAKTERRAEDLKVSLPTAVVGVRGTVFRAGHMGANSQTEVLEGRVQADNPAQKSGAAVNAGFGAVIDPNQREVKTVALLAAPDLRASATDLNKPNAEFAFAGIDGATSYRVQVARDAAFNDLVQDSGSDRPRASLSALPEGNWYLRARGIDKLGLEGLDGVTRVAVLAPKPALAPVAVIPLPPLFAPLLVTRSRMRFLNDQTLLDLPSLDNEHVDMAVEIARDAQFSQIVLKQALADKRVNLGKLAEGNYFARFTGTDKLKRANASPVYRLSIDANWGVSVVDQSAPLELMR